MKRKTQIVLYFLDGHLPSEADLDAMDAYGARYNVRQRNAQMVSSDGALEAFDIVAGAVPERYRLAAEAKGPPPIDARGPVTPVASVPAGSPVEPVAAPKTAKAPDAKPEAAKGWKPNS